MSEDSPAYLAGRPIEHMDWREALEALVNTQGHAFTWDDRGLLGKVILDQCGLIEAELNTLTRAEQLRQQETKPTENPEGHPDPSTVKAAQEDDPARPFNRHETALLFDRAFGEEIRKNLQEQAGKLIRDKVIADLLRRIEQLEERTELLEACTEKHDRIAREALELFQDTSIENSELEEGPQ